MKKLLVAGALTAAAAFTAGLLLWPQTGLLAQGKADDPRDAAIARSLDKAQAPQLNTEGCSCSKPTVLAGARESVSVWHCVCPGITCVITAGQGGSGQVPNVAQHCR
ncbi:MAG TPA: hypothetical protein VFR86_11620 [Burkholderiaceae bacterium]|nr:hypothetical protein [Burkholderiaceae bacterium]